MMTLVHTSFVNRGKLLKLGWEVTPAYSLVLAPSDYHLFLNLKNSLNDKIFTNDNIADITQNIILHKKYVDTGP